MLAKQSLNPLTSLALRGYFIRQSLPAFSQKDLQNTCFDNICFGKSAIYDGYSAFSVPLLQHIYKQIC